MRKDLRARITVKTLDYNLPFGGPGKILRENKGIIFPLTPDITTSNSVEYVPYSLPHTIYQPHAYGKTNQPQIQISARFIQQTREEAEYFIGTKHFLNVVSKIHFGRNDPLRGTPPPVLLFSAYGPYNFHRIPVVLSSYSIIYQSNIDYLEVDIDNVVVHVPSDVLIAMDIIIQQNPAKVLREFNMQDFANGTLYNRGFI